LNGFESLMDRADRWAREKGERTAYVMLRNGEEPEGAITYAGLAQRSREVAARLQSVVPGGSRVLLVFNSGIDFVVGFLGCLYAGMVAVPSNNPKPGGLHWQRLCAVAEDCGASVLLTTSQNLEAARESMRTSPAIERLPRICVDEPVSARCAWRRPELRAESLAFLQYTSGSTGTPKGVMVTHGNLMSNATAMCARFRDEGDAVILNWLPLFHDLGLIGNVLQSLYVGAQCYLMSPQAFIQQPLRWLRAISRFRATTSMAPNFAYERCVELISAEERASLDLSSWTLALNGAEPIRAATIEAFTRTFGECGFSGLATFPAYGLAEGTLIVVTGTRGTPPVEFIADREALLAGTAVRGEAHDPARTVRIVGSGRAIDGTQVAIVDRATRLRCADGVIGELWVRGPGVCAGYWQRPAETDLTFGARLADDEHSSYLRTGDLAFAWDGEIYITGRVKELIIIRGQNFFPQDIESAIQVADPRLRRDCGAAFGIDVDGAEALVVVQEVERTELRRLDVPEVCAAIRRAVAEAFDLHVHGIVLLKPTTLPKTSSGKIRRQICRQQFGDGEFAGEIARDVRAVAVTLAGDTATVPLGPGTPHEDRAQVRRQLVARLAELLGMDAESIEDEVSMADYGLDSSLAVGLSGEIGRWVGTQQDPGLLWSCPTVQALVEHVLDAVRVRRERQEFALESVAS